MCVISICSSATHVAVHVFCFHAVRQQIQISAESRDLHDVIKAPDHFRPRGHRADRCRKSRKEAFTTAPRAANRIACRHAPNHGTRRHV